MYSKEIEIPEGVGAELLENKIKVSGPKGTLEKSFQLTKEVKMEKVDNKIKVFSESERRDVKALIGTIAAHIKNLFEGVTKGFTYRLKVVFSHFPITVKVEGDKVLIQNFLGERTARIAKIVGNTEVKVSGQEITVSGIDLEKVSQTAANIEQATRIVGYDRRRFPDGIFIVSKGE
ncbi:MAG: 50S ribosomal protein L6 [Candidatus Aenigmatarchaeota archaeon]